MNRNINAVTAGLVATLALGLVGCGGSTEDLKVSGLRDDVKHVAGKKGKPAKTHTKTEAKTKSECTLRVKGVCKASRTVPDGTKTVTVTDRPAVPSKPAKWCIELDDVNGKPDSDDRWFTVTAATFLKFSGKNEGAKITDMKAVHEGC